jgi:hypothetical protein
MTLPLIPAVQGKVNWEARWRRRAAAEEQRLHTALDADAARAVAQLHAHLTLLAVVILVSLTILTAGFGEQALVVVTCSLNGAQEYLDYLRR